MGAIQFILFILAWLFFPNPKKHNIERQSSKASVETLPMLPLLKIPLFSLTLLMLFCGCVSINFVEPNIQLHLLPVKNFFFKTSVYNLIFQFAIFQLNLTPIHLGIVFFIPALIYVIVTPFVGYLCDKVYFKIFYKLLYSFIHLLLFITVSQISTLVHDGQCIFFNDRL